MKIKEQTRKLAAG